MVGHLSPDQGETWWQELCLPCCLQHLILQPVFSYAFFLCSFRLQHSGFLFTPSSVGRVHWCLLTHCLYPQGEEGCQTVASLFRFRRCHTLLNDMLTLQAKAVENSSESKRKEMSQIWSWRACCSVQQNSFSLSGSKSSSDSFTTAAISWFVLLIACLLPIYAQLILLCSAEESQADEPVVVKSPVSNLETFCSRTYICT